jgi:tRNA dimethylallyltransferase
VVWSALMAAVLKEILFVCGPTASGKSDLVHRIYRDLRAAGREVSLVNLDAFQFYRGFDIGTAKPSVDEQAEFPYAFVDFLEPDQTSDAQEYAAAARAYILAERDKGRIVIAVGGSGLYLRGLLHGLDVLPGRNPLFRNFVREVAAHQGRGTVYNWLVAIDPERAGQLHVHDLVRVERALEIYFATGVRASESAGRVAPPRDQARILDATVANFAFEREVLDARIQQRTRSLIVDPGHHHSEGPWLLEVRRLLVNYGADFDGLSASRAIGYREIAADLWDGAAQTQRESLSQAKLGELSDRIVTLTRQYAKRQSTWMANAAVDVTLRRPSDVLDFADSFVRAHCR